VTELDVGSTDLSAGDGASHSKHRTKDRFPMTRISQRRASRTLALLGTTLAVGAAGLASSPAAQAASETQYCSLGGLSTCWWPRHTLTSVRTTGPSGTSMAAGASWEKDESGLYANWAWGTSKPCHAYGAGNLLYPLMKNGTSYANGYSGTSTWGSGAASC
jgi:hypothetical protein